MPAKVCAVDADDFFDLVIIGAGPCGLALAARLAEKSPAAIYSDAEHGRMHWLKRRGEVKVKGGKRKLVDRSVKCPACSVRRILVLDASAAGWMARWQIGFEQLGIKTLRSPLHFHPAPDDTDALRAYAERTQRHAETTEVRYIERQRKTRRTLTTRERQINERDRRDYMTASTSLFDDFCDDLVQRYRLAPLVRHAEVVDVTYGKDALHLSDGSGHASGFCVETKAGGRIGAKAVAVACGSTGVPSTPAAFMGAVSRAGGDAEGPGWTHSSRFLRPGLVFPSATLLRKIGEGRRVHMVVIGGGLTSAQLADLALSRGVTHVTLVLRSKIKVKLFDVPIEWVAKYSSLMKAIFWQTEDKHERLEIIKDARRGGSLTPSFNTILQRHVSAGRAVVLASTEVSAAHYNDAARSWTLDLTSGDTSSTLVNIDHVVLATGSRIDIEGLPWLRGIRQDGILSSELGFPALTPDLQAEGDADVPLFFLGAHAALQLGPGAFNLSGARESAERVAHRLGELGVFGADDGDELDGRQALAALAVNHFGALSVE